eukprot:TRINITY_DN8272_c0_g1_i1.p1 TRINITY_DN8272_c0_g1~~TRINITY_DN8272_c0_g1_i1.p1  ORF type:complete len:466 (-),score=30.74 TRINITY_DN8272_c0_g1_i1:130-1419(-)
MCIRDRFIYKTSESHRDRSKSQVTEGKNRRIAETLRERALRFLGRIREATNRNNIQQIFVMTISINHQSIVHITLLFLTLLVSTCLSQTEKVWATVMDANNTIKYTAGSVLENNKNHAWVSKTEGTEEKWKITYDNTPSNTHAYLLFIDPVTSDPWVVFYVSSGSNEDNAIQKLSVFDKPFKGVLFENYGAPQNLEVAGNVLAMLDRETGLIKKGTFLMAKTVTGNIMGSGQNSFFLIQSLSVSSTEVAFQAVSKNFPPGKESKANMFIIASDAVKEKRDPAGLFSMQYTMTRDLSKITKATVLPPATVHVDPTASPRNLFATRDMGQRIVLFVMILFAVFSFIQNQKFKQTRCITKQNGWLRSHVLDCIIERTHHLSERILGRKLFDYLFLKCPLRDFLFVQNVFVSAVRCPNTEVVVHYFCYVISWS